MKRVGPIAVAFREVRHFRPDDCLHCEAIAVRGRQHDWTIPAHRHEGLHQFQLIERGRVRAILDQVPRVLDAPAALMLAPGCVHAFEYERETVGHQVTVPTAMLAGALADSPALAAGLAATRVADAAAIADGLDRVRSLFASLIGEFDAASPGRTVALRSHAVLLALWFLRAGGASRPEEARRALRDTLVQRYRALLERHLREHRPLADYARSLGVTPDHLSRSCRAVTGRGALELLHDRVMAEARRLLAYTDATVAQVAEELGFPDPAYFSRFFSRRSGLSPLAFRSAAQRGEASVDATRAPPRSPA